MDSKEHRPRQSPPDAPETSRPSDSGTMEQRLRDRRAALMVKAVTSVARPNLQDYFVKALHAHEIDTLNLSKD